MIYEALQTYLTATATAQTGVEDFFFDYAFEMNSPNFGKGGSGEKSFPAIYVEPPDGAFNDVRNTYPKGVENGIKYLGLRFTIVDPEIKYTDNTDTDKANRSKHLDTLEGLLRDYVSEVLSKDNPALGGLVINRQGREANITFRPHQGNGNYLMVTTTINVAVTVPCAGGTFDYSGVTASGTLGINFGLTETTYTFTAHFKAISTRILAAPVGTTTYTMTVGGVDHEVGDTINIGDEVVITITRGAVGSVLFVIDLDYLGDTGTIVI